jgi:phospholipid-binding lipoprotein MlaA
MTVVLMLLSGCASTGGDHRDPIEGFNRAVYKFNDGLDRVVFKPIAKGYRAVMPGPLDKGVSNFFGNIEDVVTTVNDLLQFKFRQGGSDALRVLVNSTIGILGLIDVASRMGLDKHDEDFGQTLGYWGVGTGPYLVLPIYGPSNLRDATGKFVDASAFDPIYKIDHIPTRNTLRAIEGVDNRADLLGASNVLEEAALDKYNFLKESYFQQREHAINDGELTFPE